MLEKLKQSWRRFQLNEPGQRFQKRYDQQRKFGHGMLRRIFIMGSGLLLVAVGIFFLPAPGPGLVIVFMGAGLLAQESLWTARVLDWSELGLRSVYVWSVNRWRAISVGVKMLLGLAALILLAAFTFGMYQVFFAN